MPTAATQLQGLQGRILTPADYGRGWGDYNLGGGQRGRAPINPPQRGQSPGGNYPGLGVVPPFARPGPDLNQPLPPFNPYNPVGGGGGGGRWNQPLPPFRPGEPVGGGGRPGLGYPIQVGPGGPPQWGGGTGAGNQLVRTPYRQIAGTVGGAGRRTPPAFGGGGGVGSLGPYPGGGGGGFGGGGGPTNTGGSLGGGGGPSIGIGWSQGGGGKQGIGYGGSTGPATAPFNPVDYAMQAWAANPFGYSAGNQVYSQNWKF